MLTFQDIFKSSFLENAASVSLFDMALALLLSFGLGMFIFLVYKKTFSGVMYSSSFGVTLVALTMITTLVILAVTSNVVLSLGMVGALSIVRFRTSIKDSRDTTYIFWTIIIGICCGVGDFMVASIGSAGVFLVLLALGRVKNENRMLLVVRGNFEKEDDIRKTVFEYFTKPPVMKAENTSGDSVELIYELDRRSMMASAKRETAQAAAEGRQRATIIRRLRDLGGIEYVNIVVQSDEIS